RLDLRCIAADRSRGERRRLGRAPGSARKRFLEAEVLERRRIDASSELPQIVQHLGQLLADLGQLSRELRILVCNVTSGELELHSQGKQMLLCAIVEIAFDLAALGMAGCRDSRTGSA